MKYSIKTTSKYRKSLRKAVKKGLDLKELTNIVNMLASGQQLPPKNRNHKLSGNLSGLMECHIQPDWLLIYQIQNNELILLLYDTGTHSELFDN